MSLSIQPLSLAEAGAAVEKLHRHHRKPQGHKFSLALMSGKDLVGVAVVGRPVARAFDDGLTLEVTRVATDGATNACSALYGAAWRTARAAGYRRLITYTQDGESGASLRAVGWRRAAELSPRRGWDTPSRHRDDRGTDRIARVLWEITTANAAPAMRARDAIRDEIQCLACGDPMPLRRGRGRPARYCTPRCRQRAFRHRAEHSGPNSVTGEALGY
ncbi:XF1762 family protein [Kitasatospora terrestris]|uniref:Zinc finger CGNR domain-containing protein n=1 Tax=Kitasatospora terrestris TaxID=258051 RepID=A0ABP9E6B9_9ACTN